MPQSDVLIPSLTVQECLRYSALLRLPPDTSPLDLQVGIFVLRRLLVVLSCAAGRGSTLRAVKLWCFEAAQACSDKPHILHSAGPFFSSAGRH